MRRAPARAGPQTVRVALLAVLAGLLGLTAALAAPAGSARAHDRLSGSAPAAGSTAAAVPEAVVLTFTAPVLSVGAAVVVTGPDGEVQVGAPQAVGTTVRQPLRPGAPAGAYQVSWRVTSGDGHPISGEFAFSAARAGGGSGAPAAPAPALDDSGRAGWWLAVAIGLAVVGLAVAVAVVLRRRQTRAA